MSQRPIEEIAMERAMLIYQRPRMDPKNISLKRLDLRDEMLKAYGEPATSIACHNAYKLLQMIMPEK